MPSLFDLAAGQTYTVSGRYEASRKIGEGRFAVVFRAFDTRNSQDVALKVYLATDERTLARGEAEAQTLKKLGELNSPFFPKFKGAIKTLIENTPHRFLVLELGEYADPSLPPKSILTVKDLLNAVAGGEPVEAHLAFWAAETFEAFCLDLFQAVADLHSLEIIHRDIKPTNVLLKRAAGSERVYPFLLDFNAVSDSSSDTAGSKNYLPPEVTHGSRSIADNADDLWATCRLVWELLFGEGAPVTDNPRPHGLAPTHLATAALPTLRRGLAINPAQRFVNAIDLRDSLVSAFAGLLVEPVSQQEAAPSTPAPPTPKSDTSNFYSARAEEERIRLDVIYTLEASDAPPIPKEMRELVAMALETCADGSSTAIDLKADLMALGPAAFPAILEQSYKLQLFSPEWDLCREALSLLSQQNRSLAIRSVHYYCVSSSYAVRHLCMELCESLDVLPAELVDLFANDNILLDADEREHLLNLIFAHAKDDSVFFWLVSYMTKQLIADPRRYKRLRDTVAHRLGTLPGEQHAEALKAFANDRTWTRMPAYTARHPNESEDADANILSLVAEGFSRLAQPADFLLQWHPDVLRARTARPWQRKVWLEFMKQTLAAMPESEQLLQNLATRSQDIDLMVELDRLRNRAPLTEEEALELFRAFLSGDDDTPRTYHRLRHDRTGAVIQLLRNALQRDPSWEECDRCVYLLEGFQNRARVRVVDCVTANWQRLKNHDLRRACNILTQAPLDPGRAHTRAVDLLDAELRATGSPYIRETLAKLLS